MDDLNLIQSYLRDIDQALQNTKDEDILILFRELYEKEQSFAKRLRQTGYGKNVYRAFITKILNSRGGIKKAKSYFRARQNSFKGTINKAIKERNPELMYNVPVNYKFCLFSMEALETKEAVEGKLDAYGNKVYRNKLDERGNKIYKDKKLPALFEEIKKLRGEIISKHLYFSLNRAKIFKQTAYGYSTRFEDLIQMANEALIVAVDKYVIDDDSSTFHVMAYGRILSNLIENGEETFAATVGPDGKKGLYQIRKLLQKNPNLSTAELANIMKVAEEEVADLIGSTSYQSLDNFVGDDSNTRLIEIFTTEDNNRSNPQETLVKNDLLSVLSDSFDVLSVMEKKVLRLKGVKL